MYRVFGRFQSDEIQSCSHKNKLWIKHKLFAWLEDLVYHATRDAVAYLYVRYTLWAMVNMERFIPNLWFADRRCTRTIQQQQKKKEYWGNVIIDRKVILIGHQITSHYVPFSRLAGKKEKRTDRPTDRGAIQLIQSSAMTRSCVQWFSTYFFFSAVSYWFLWNFVKQSNVNWDTLYSFFSVLWQIRTIDSIG